MEKECYSQSRERGRHDFFGFCSGARTVPEHVNLEAYCAGLIDLFNESPCGMTGVKNWLVETGRAYETSDGMLA